MKKLMLLLVPIVSFVLLNAVDLNVSAGLTFPSISQEVTLQGTAGFSGGVSIPFNRAGSVLIEPGIRFRNMKFYWESLYEWYDGSKDIDESTTNINYFDLYIKAKLNPLQNVETNVKIYPNIGFGMGIFSSGKSKRTSKEIYNGVTINKYTYTYNFEDDANSNVFSILIGMDLLINNSVTLGFEYNRALNSIFRDDTVRSSTIMINLGYLLPS